MASQEKWNNMEGSCFKGRQSLCVILTFLASNFVTLYVGVSWHSLISPSSLSNYNPPQIYMAPLFNTLTSQLNLTQTELHIARQELSQLRRRLHASEELSKSLLSSGSFPNSSTHMQENATEEHIEPHSSNSLQETAENVHWIKSFAPVHMESHELREYMTARKLPLGWSSGMAAMSMVSPIGHACGSEANKKDLIKYMGYEKGGVCPDDQGLAHTLTVHGCEPLPRRRCFARGPPHYKEPLSLPESLWSTPSDDSILWTSYTCKSFECLNERKKKRVFEDCIDCFELQGREKQRWTKHTSDLDFSIHEVLLLKPGSIRIGLDIGGGTGKFFTLLELVYFPFTFSERATFFSLKLLKLG